MKTFSFLLTLLVGASAFAYREGPHKQIHLLPADLGVNAATLDANVTSTSFKTAGYSQLTLACTHVNNSATEIQVEFEHSVNWFQSSTETVAAEDGNATWISVMAGDITNVSNIFTDELDVYRAHRDVSANDELTVSIPINYLRMRLQVTDTAGDASDTLTCHVILGSM